MIQTLDFSLIHFNSEIIAVKLFDIRKLVSYYLVFVLLIFLGELEFGGS